MIAFIWNVMRFDAYFITSHFVEIKPIADLIKDAAMQFPWIAWSTKFKQLKVEIKSTVLL